MSSVTVRQRKTVISPDLTGNAHNSSRRTEVMNAFRKVDLFPKPREDFAEEKQSLPAAIVSVVAIIVLFLLVCVEVIGYIAPGETGWTHSLTVDAGVSGMVPIHFNITFFGIQCGDLNIDAMDTVGAQQNNVHHDLYKSPIDRLGRLVYHGYYTYVERRLADDGTPLGPKIYDSKKDPSSKDFCGKCYIKPKTHHHKFDKEGGVIDHHFSQHHGEVCCNTCQQVMDMYDMHRIPRPHIEEVEQCIAELSAANPGCNLAGMISVRKVKGNFHFVPGESFEFGPQGFHVHKYDPSAVAKFNITHRIESLWYGTSSVAADPMPLKQHLHIAQNLQMAKYFMKVVPNAVNDENGFTYSTTKYVQDVELGNLRASPGLFFVYDFTPIHLHKDFQRPAFSHFLVQVCSLLGGLFVVHSLIHRAVREIIPPS
eukprot:PhF_6_TR22374/c0_g1_i1/m.31730/K20367/ERGIC3, ERV46; endoplasmic reticulum-Golgi intermediate compartment protein 3